MFIIPLGLIHGQVNTHTHTHCAQFSEPPTAWPGQFNRAVHQQLLERVHRGTLPTSRWGGGGATGQTALSSVMC